MLLTGFAILWLILGMILAVLICIGKIPFVVFMLYWGLSSLFYLITRNKTKGVND
jgi:predicted membrane-bound mannosyltransferase